MSFKQLGALAQKINEWQALYTCPTGKTTVVSRILFTNKSTVTADFLLLAGASLNAVYCVSGASNTPPNGQEEIAGGIILNAGESLYVYSSQSDGCSIAWGDEITASSTLKQLGAVGITQNSWTTVYTCPSGKTTFVSKIILNNGWYAVGQTEDATMYLAHIPSGQSTATKYYIVSQQKVLKNGGRIEIQGGIVLNAGDILSAYSTQTTYGTCVAWGDEQTTGTAKMLGAIDCTSGGWTDLYTVPSGKQTVVSKIIVTNNSTSSEATSACIEHLPSGGGDEVKYFITSYERILRNGGQNEVTGGVTMTTGDKLRVYIIGSDCTAIAWGDEMNV